MIVLEHERGFSPLKREMNTYRGTISGRGDRTDVRLRLSGDDRMIVVGQTIFHFHQSFLQVDTLIDVLRGDVMVTYPMQRVLDHRLSFA